MHNTVFQYDMDEFVVKKRSKLYPSFKKVVESHFVSEMIVQPTTKLTANVLLGGSITRYWQKSLIKYHTEIIIVYNTKGHYQPCTC